MSHLVKVAKITITHSILGQIQQNQNNIEGYKNSFGHFFRPKMSNYCSFGENCVTHVLINAHTPTIHIQSTN